jgi:hypothetical protein
MVAHHTLPELGHHLQIVPTAHVDFYDGESTTPSAGQAELPQDLLGLFAKVIRKGDFTADLFTELVEESPRAGKADELQKGLFQREYSSANIPAWA